MLRSITSGEEIIDEECFYVAPDGGPLWVRCSFSPVRDVDGEIVAAVVAQTDVSERKREEARLAVLAGLLDNTEDAIIAFDGDWRVTAWNKVGTSMWGRAVDEQRTVWFETVSPGTRRWVEVRAFPREDGGLSVYSRDISDRKRAEEQLERRAAQQAAVAELGLRALEHVGLRSLMDEAVALVCRTLGVEYAKVDELLPGGDGLLVRAGAGWRDRVVGNCMLPTGRGSPAGYALLAGEPLIAEDMTADILSRCHRVARSRRDERHHRGDRPERPSVRDARRGVYRAA